MRLIIMRQYSDEANAKMYNSETAGKGTTVYVCVKLLIIDKAVKLASALLSVHYSGKTLNSFLIHNFFFF